MATYTRNQRDDSQSSDIITQRCALASPHSSHHSCHRQHRRADAADVYLKAEYLAIVSVRNCMVSAGAVALSGLALSTNPARWLHIPSSASLPDPLAPPTSSKGSSLTASPRAPKTKSFPSISFTTERARILKLPLGGIAIGLPSARQKQAKHKQASHAESGSKRSHSTPPVTVTFLSTTVRGHSAT